MDTPVHTDQEVKADGPDIIIERKDDKSCLPIDVSIPANRNTSVKVVEKLLKYEDLNIEIERMLGMKKTTVPVVIGALCIITKGTGQFIHKMPGNIRLP